MALSSKTTHAVHAVRRKIEKAVDPDRRARTARLRELGVNLSFQAASPDYAGPDHLQQVAQSYRPGGFETTSEGRVPLLWWTTSDNYGDLLSPWLVGKMTGRKVTYRPARGTHYLAIGSIAGRARSDSIVWGSGMASGERKWATRTGKEYRAVRGPLSRALLRNVGIHCPEVYGDPALLAPLYFWPEVDKKHEIGLVIRWSEDKWRGLSTSPGVKLIDFGTADVEATTRQVLACKRIVSSSLHGLIVADAYGIPNAWLDSDGWAGGSRPSGGEFKFYDYMISVNKVRHSQQFDPLAERLDVDTMLDRLEFDDRAIGFNHTTLLDASPFVERV